MKKIALALALVAAALLSACTNTLADTEMDLADAAAREAIRARSPEAARYLKSLPRSGAHYDGGGLVSQYQFRVAYLLVSSHEFVVPKYCKSACTSYLGLADDPETCFPRDGEMWFHPPVPLNGSSASAAYGVMAAHIAVADPALAASVVLRVRALGPGEWVVLGNADLIAAGYIRPCD